LVGLKWEKVGGGWKVYYNSKQKKGSPLLKIPDAKIRSVKNEFSQAILRWGRRRGGGGKEIPVWGGKVRKREIAFQRGTHNSPPPVRKKEQRKFLGVNEFIWETESKTMVA